MEPAVDRHGLSGERPLSGVPAPRRGAAAIAKQRSEMEGAVKSGESRVEFTASKSSRAQQLIKDNYVSAEARDQAASEHKIAQADLLDARDNRRVAALEYKRQMELIRLKTIRSPIDGVVVETAPCETVDQKTA